MSQAPGRVAPPKTLATLWTLVGVIGLIASFELANEYVKTLENPTYVPNCSINPVVTCGPNMASWQGHVFGFPNPLLGLICFAFPLAVGVSIWAGAKFAGWYHALYNLGFLGAYIFITWLYSQSIFSLGTLCPWCMVVWAVVIPSFWYTTGWNLRRGTYGSGLKKFGEAVYDWAWVLTALNYILIAVLAQIRLDWLSLLF